MKKKQLAKRKIQISIALPVEDVEKIKRLAEADHRSISNFVYQHGLMPYLEQKKESPDL